MEISAAAVANACRFQSGSHGFEIFGSRQNLEIASILAHIVGAGAKRHFHQLLFIRRRFLDDEIAFSVEHPADAARFAQVPAVLGKNVSHFGNRAIPVIRQDVHKDGDAAGPISFIIHIFVGNAGKFSRSRA